MSATGQLQLGLTEVYAPGTNTVIGYAYTEQNETGQIQRWLLFRSPGNALDVRAPSPTARLTATSPSDWQSKVKSLWQKGWLYVWAQADVYSHGVTYGDTTWNQIPPTSALPAPTYPNVDAASAQLDPDCKALKITQDGRQGLVFTTAGETDKTSGRTDLKATVEYWLLPALYEPAGVSTSTSIVPDGSNLMPDGSNLMYSALTEDRGESLQRFIKLANESWEQGCRFVITGCITYSGESPPANP